MKKQKTEKEKRIKLEINQIIYYKASLLESMVEKYLDKYNLNLGKAEVWGNSIRRKLDHSKLDLTQEIEIFYEKMGAESGKEFEGYNVSNDALIYCKSLGGDCNSVNVRNVFDFLNDQSKIEEEAIIFNILETFKVRDYISNKAIAKNKYGEGIKFVYKYKKDKSFFLIDCQDPFPKGARRLFAEAFNSYFNANFPRTWFSWGGQQFNETTLSKAKINNLARKAKKRPKQLKVEEYLDIMIKYLIRSHF